MNFDDIQFSSHAIQRMFERGITRDDVIEVIFKWDVIYEYPEDKPHSSCLLLGVINKNPIHIVVSVDNNKSICYIITVYHPDSNIWNDDFRQRRK